MQYVKKIPLCSRLLLTCAFSVLGQTTKKEAADALTKGINAAKNNDFNSAVSYYTKTIELDPKYVDAYSNRGEAHNAQGKTKETEADFALAKSLEK